MGSELLRVRKFLNHEGRFENTDLCLETWHRNIFERLTVYHLKGPCFAAEMILTVFRVMDLWSS